MQTRLWKLTLLIVVVALLAACGGQSAQPAPKATAAPAAVATQAPAPTKAPEPTAAPKVEPTQPKPTDTPKPAPSPTPEPPKPTAAPTQPPAPSGADGANLIFDAMRAQLASKSFRMTMNTEDGDKKTTMTIEYVAPDRFHMIQASGTEIILLKEGMYQRSTKDGPWNKLPGEMGSNIVTTILDPKNIEELKNTVSVDQVKFLGPELLDGKLMWVDESRKVVPPGPLTKSHKVVPATSACKRSWRQARADKGKANW